jgi:plastocyanin
MRLRSIKLQALAGAGAALATAIVLVPAAAQGGAHAARGHTVVLKNIRFNPSTLSIHRGDTVTWVWRDGATKHNVTGTRFKSHTMAKGSFTVRFTRTGTFSYHCTIHVSLGMRGKIVVH